MNNRRRLLFVVPAALLLAGCEVRERVVGPKRTVTVNRSWPASQINEIRVRSSNGSVTVEAAPTDQITLVATATGRALEPKEGVENKGLFETAIDGDVLRIGRRDRSRRRHFDFLFFDRDGRAQVSYKLRVPATVSLDMATVNGRIVTRGVEGETEASTVNGSIDVEVAGTNELEATTVNGRVQAKFTRTFQGARFKTVNGTVRATLPDDASFMVDLAQVNGDFEASFPVSIHSQPGSRRVSGEVNGGQHRLKIVTVNGAVRLARLND